jgi:YHS domain-containing protein
LADAAAHVGVNTIRSKKKMTIIYALAGLLLIALLGVGVMYANRISPLGLNLHKSVFHVDGVALDGYDVTSYFKGKPERGSPAHAAERGGVTFLFVSAEARSEFVSDPRKYLPEFGGYCTKAVSTGFAAPADPEIFAVVEDKLYIFSSEEVKKEFLNAPQPIVAACEAKWTSHDATSN